MFSIFSNKLSIIVSKDGRKDDLRRSALLNNAGAVMYSQHKDEWNALVLYFDENYRVVDADEIHITPDSFSPSNWKIVSVVGEQLISRSRK